MAKCAVVYTCRPVPSLLWTMHTILTWLSRDFVLWPCYLSVSACLGPAMLCTLPTLMLIAQAVFLLAHRQTDNQTHKLNWLLYPRHGHSHQCWWLELWVCGWFVLAVNVTLLELILDCVIHAGHRDCSYENPTKRCPWHAAECGKYSSVIFIGGIIVAIIFQPFSALKKSFSSFFRGVPLGSHPIVE